MVYLILFLKLVVGHCLTDYPLQGDFLAKAKNHKQPIPGVPWYQALGAHAAIQAGMVWFVTGSLTLGGVEFVAHSTIDYLKCAEQIDFNADQILHLLCKLAYVSFLAIN